MANIKGVIGIEFDLLEEMLRNIVRQEVTEISKEVKQALIYNYIKNGTLPEPKRDISGHPYWTPDQLERAIKLRGIKANFPV